MNHRQRVTESDVDVIAGDRISSRTDSGNTEDRSDVVMLLDTRLRVPDNVVTVVEDSNGECRAVVSSNAGHYQPERQNEGCRFGFDSMRRCVPIPGDLTLSLELIEPGCGLDDVLYADDNNISITVPDLISEAVNLLFLLIQAEQA